MEIPNITNFTIPNEILSVGTICNLVDQIDPTIGTMCTIRFVEQDPDYPQVIYYYLRANDDEKNINTDSRFGSYFDMISADSNRLIVLAQPTVY